MVNKDELSDKINEYLSLDDTIDFSGMKKEELERFVEFLKEPANQIQAGLKRMRDRVRGDILDRPLREYLEGDPKDDKGPLGLGILPRARDLLRPKP